MSSPNAISVRDTTGLSSKKAGRLRQLSALAAALRSETLVGHISYVPDDLFLMLAAMLAGLGMWTTSHDVLEMGMYEAEDILRQYPDLEVSMEKFQAVKTAFLENIVKIRRMPSSF